MLVGPPGNCPTCPCVKTALALGQYCFLICWNFKSLDTVLPHVCGISYMVGMFLIYDSKKNICIFVDLKSWMVINRRQSFSVIKIIVFWNHWNIWINFCWIVTSMPMALCKMLIGNPRWLHPKDKAFALNYIHRIYIYIYKLENK